MIGRSGERWSGISVLAAQHDDDDDMVSSNNILKLLCQLGMRDELATFQKIFDMKILLLHFVEK